MGIIARCMVEGKAFIRGLGGLLLAGGESASEIALCTCHPSLDLKSKQGFRV